MTQKTSENARSESPTQFAHRIGLQRGFSQRAWSWSDCLDAAVRLYWQRRGKREAA